MEKFLKNSNSDLYLNINTFRKFCLLGNFRKKGKVKSINVK